MKVYVFVLSTTEGSGVSHFVVEWERLYAWKECSVEVHRTRRKSEIRVKGGNRDMEDGSEDKVRASSPSCLAQDAAEHSSSYV
jgi:hypothetical protein